MMNAAPYNVAPPAYQADGRPTGLWRLCDVDGADVSPWLPLKTMTWGRAADVAEMEIDFRPNKVPFKPNKFSFYMGPRGSAPLGWTYKPLSGTLARVDKQMDVVCTHKTDRRRNAQSLTFTVKGVKFVWHASQVMSSCFGNVFDTTTYTLTHNDTGDVLATFAFLQPNGALDALLNVHRHGVLDEDLLLTTLPIFMYHQWEEMLHELRTNVVTERIPTWRTVQQNLTPGRMCMYEVESYEHVEYIIGEIGRARRHASATSSNNAAAATNAAVLSI